jgi:hypothetical protein
MFGVNLLFMLTFAPMFGLTPDLILIFCELVMWRERPVNARICAPSVLATKILPVPHLVAQASLANLAVAMP